MCCCFVSCVVRQENVGTYCKRIHFLTFYLLYFSRTRPLYKVLTWRRIDSGSSSEVPFLQELRNEFWNCSTARLFHEYLQRSCDFWNTLWSVPKCVCRFYTTLLYSHLDCVISSYCYGPLERSFQPLRVVSSDFRDSSRYLSADLICPKRD